VYVVKRKFLQFHVGRLRHGGARPHLIAGLGCEGGS
jgi:hypothetical protein